MRTAGNAALQLEPDIGAIIARALVPGLGGGDIVLGDLVGVGDIFTIFIISHLVLATVYGNVTIVIHSAFFHGEGVQGAFAVPGNEIRPLVGEHGCLSGDLRGDTLKQLLL